VSAYRALVLVAWTAWTFALALLPFELWVRFGAAIVSGLGFGTLLDAQKAKKTGGA